MNKYVYFADRYVLQITSNHQEKDDLLKADHLAQKLSKNLDEEVDIFVDRLADVVDEGKRGESFP